MDGFRVDFNFPWSGWVGVSHLVELLFALFDGLLIFDFRLSADPLEEDKNDDGMLIWDTKLLAQDVQVQSSWNSR